MRVPILAILAAILATSTACVMSAMQIPTPTPPASATPAPSATARPTQTATQAAEDVQTATIRATVYVRQSADANSPEVGSLTTGETVEVIGCSGEWCEVRTDVLTGFVWRGCTSDNPAGLRCEARP